MSDILDPIPSPDGTPEEQTPQDLPIDVSEPASLPIDVIDSAPPRKAASSTVATPPPIKPATAKTDPDKKKKTWIIVAVVALLVLLLCCCVLPLIGVSVGFFDEYMQEVDGYGFLLLSLVI
ncbi:MAG: hypothetical protein K8R77_05250 [Anaerolineaceae bacterium]|nr:hypothetical protein [Anaerolineaceae bacterium]